MNIDDFPTCRELKCVCLFCDLWDIKDKQEAEDSYEAWRESIPDDLKPAFKPLTTAVGNWKGEIFAWWDYPGHKCLYRGSGGACEAYQPYRERILIQGDTGKADLLQPADSS